MGDSKDDQFLFKKIKLNKIREGLAYLTFAHFHHQNQNEQISLQFQCLSCVIFDCTKAFNVQQSSSSVAIYISHSMNFFKQGLENEEGHRLHNLVTEHLIVKASEILANTGCLGSKGAKPKV